MGEAVRGDLVTGCGDRAHYLRAILREPAENEERAARARARQRSKQQIDATRNAAWMCQPLVARDDGLERFDLKVLLHIYREEVFGPTS